MGFAKLMLLPFGNWEASNFFALIVILGIKISTTMCGGFRTFLFFNGPMSVLKNKKDLKCSSHLEVSYMASG